MRSEMKPSDYAAQILQEEEDKRTGAKVIRFPKWEVSA